MGLIDHSFSELKHFGKGIIPESLYKYYPNDANSKDALLHNSIWFNPIAAVKDPLDSMSIIADEYIMGYVDRQLEKTFAEAKKLGHKISKPDLRNLLFDFFKNGDKPFADIIQSHVRASSLTCFTTVNNNRPMWENYSSNYQGFILKFDLRKDKNFQYIHPVIYTREQYTAQSIFDSLNGYMIKDLNYSYEKEYRMIVTHKGYRKYNPKSLVSIIFGLKSCKQYRDEILNVLSVKKFRHVLLLESKLSPEGLIYRNLAN